VKQKGTKNGLSTGKPLNPVQPREVTIMVQTYFVTTNNLKSFLLTGTWSILATNGFYIPNFLELKLQVFQNYEQDNNVSKVKVK
jgi:hypothetical protein